MRKLTVLYDARCGFCSACRRWLEVQPQLVSLEFLPAGSDEARRRFPTLTAAEPEELVVVSDDGGVYRDSHAWIMCLWALDEFREWSFRLARPALLPLARTVFEWVSERRRGISSLLGIRSDHDLAAVLTAGTARVSSRCDPPRAEKAR